MLRSSSLISFLSLVIILSVSCSNQERKIANITPNQFEGTDIQRIQSAIDAAQGTTNKIFIPSKNANGTNLWLLDSAILLPDSLTIILDNCTIQLSDQCRDNMFRSDNVGIGIKNPKWNNNISIIGLGDVSLKGADNPRSSGDGARMLTLNPDKEVEKGNWRVSYGSDAGKEGIKQKGDWRNIMILMAHVNGFTMRNINIENSHAWAVSFERTLNADISDIRINNPEQIIVNGKTVNVSNKDGIDLRQGCKNFRIDNISGRTGDDFIALSNLDTHMEGHENGSLNSTMVTMSKWKGPEDDIEQIAITNITCQTKYRGIAIRASDSASIHHITINGLITQKWDGYNNSILIGGLGYGKPSIQGKINNIKAMNITGNGRSLILIEAPISNCYFSNGVYSGDGKNIISYKIDKKKTKNINSHNLVHLK
jgi:glycosyl hydrolase family 28